MFYVFTLASMFLQLWLEQTVLYQGRSDGGISVYIPPKSVTVLFTCGTITHVLKLQ